MSDFQEPVQKPRRQPPSFFWPLVLVGAGVMLLLSNLGYVPWSSWNVLWRLWPLLLVALGIDLLIGRRSLVGAIVSGILILALIGGAVALMFFAQNIPALVEMTQPAEWRTEQVAHPLGDVESATVNIDWSSVPGRLSALNDSNNLIEGDITYRGELIFDVYVRGSKADVKLDTYYSGPWGWSIDYEGRPERDWDIQLHPGVSYDLTLDTGSGRCDLDLSELEISDLYLDSGSGAIDLKLPSGGSFVTRIDSGSGRVAIAIPDGVGVRVVLDSGSGAFRPDARFQLVSGERDDDGVWETENYDTAADTIDLHIDQGSGSIRIEK